MEGIFQTDVQLGQTMYVMLNTFYGESIIKAQLYTKNGLERNNRISIFSSDFLLFFILQYDRNSNCFR